MPRRLTDLVIKEGALVDKGDNPLAKITFWKRRDPSEGDQMDPKATPEQVEKAHKEALSAKDTELANVRKELADAKAEFAVEFAKLKKGEEVLKADPLAGLPEDIRKRLAAADAETAELKKQLAANTESLKVAEFTKLAETIGTVPGITTTEVATILKALPKDDGDKLEKALRATAAQAKESQALLKELGRVSHDVDGGAQGPMAQLEVMAKAYAAANKVPLDVARYEVTKSGDGEKLFIEARKAEGQE